MYRVMDLGRKKVGLPLHITPPVIEQDKGALILRRGVNFHKAFSPSENTPYLYCTYCNLITVVVAKILKAGVPCTHNIFTNLRRSLSIIGSDGTLLRRKKKEGTEGRKEGKAEAAAAVRLASRG